MFFPNIFVNEIIETSCINQYPILAYLINTDRQVRLCMRLNNGDSLLFHSGGECIFKLVFLWFQFSTRKKKNLKNLKKCLTFIKKGTKKI